MSSRLAAFQCSLNAAAAQRSQKQRDLQRLVGHGSRYYLYDLGFRVLFMDY